jgi:DNA-binding NarL/FixJ family response regulator
LKKAAGALRAIVVDDHILVRESISVMLERAGAVQVVGQASTTAEAMQLLAQSSCRLLITGIGLAGDCGIALIRRVRQAHPELPILILSRHDEDQLVLEALQAGASGYILKTANPEEFLQAVREVAAGQSYLHPALAGPVVKGLRNRSETGPKLSIREREILDLLANGHSNGQIATQLNLSLSTVKTHLRTAYRKLGAVDRTQAVLLAIKLKVLDEPSGKRS